MTRVMFDILIRSPEILLTLGRTRDPRWQNASFNLVRPGILVLLVCGLDATTRHLLDDPHKRIENDVAYDTGDQAVRDTVCEWHDGDGQECGDCVADVPPVDVLGGFGPVERIAVSPVREEEEEKGV